jgi:predicted metal-binding protein
VKQVNPVIDYSVRELCTKPYPDHEAGCPNYGKKKGCPPEAPMYDEVYNIEKPVFVIANQFDFKGHVEKMRQKHPEWSKRQLECCLYWQNTARAQLTEGVNEFLKTHPEYLNGVELCPEAMGVNITETMAKAGIQLEWPPVNKVFKVALVGIRRR